MTFFFSGELTLLGSLIFLGLVWRASRAGFRWSDAGAAPAPALAATPATPAASGEASGAACVEPGVCPARHA